MVEICVGTVTYRGCHPSYAGSMLRLAARPEVSTFLHRRGDWLLERARSVVATHFLTETSADVFLWVDADIVFQPEDALEICRQAMDYSVIGGLYLMRQGEQAMPAARPEEPLMLEGRPRPTRVQWIGTGFLAAHRRVFQALLDRPDMRPCQSDDEAPFWPFYYPMLLERDGSHMWLGEDVAFCERARQEGFEVYVNPAVQLTHMGSREYRVADMAPRAEGSTPRRIVPYRRPDGKAGFHLELRPAPTRGDQTPAQVVDLAGAAGAGAV